MKNIDPLEFTLEELEQLSEALDSHIYWQLSDSHYRESGFVIDPGSDDPYLVEEIQEVRTLMKRIEQAIIDRRQLTEIVDNPELPAGVRETAARELVRYRYRRGR